MPLYTKPRVNPIAFDESTDWLKPTLGEYLSTAAADAIHDLPSVAIADQSEMYALASQAAGISTEEDESGFPVVTYSKQRPEILDKDSQAQRIKDAGLEQDLKPQDGYNAAMLDVIIERKREEVQRRAVRQAAPDAWAPLGLATGLGTSLIDPINIASAFFPVVGEARALSLLGKASGAWGRAGVRAGIGAVEGAVGAAVVEPLIAVTRFQEQADYDKTEALINIGFGAIFGAALQPTAGAIGDHLRAKSGQRQPWELTAPTSDTIALKDAHAQEIHDARLETSSSLDNARLSQEAHAAAAIFDARARAWSHDLQRPVQEFYDIYKPEYRAGNGTLDEDALTHAMYRNRAPSLQAFIDEVLAGTPQDKKSYIGIGPVDRADTPEFHGSEIMLASDQVRHIRKDHPDFSEWGRIPEAVTQGEITALGNNRVTGGPAYAFVLPGNEEKALAVFAAPMRTKEGNRLRVLTAFEDSKKGVENWIEEQKKKAAIYQSAEEITAYPDRENGLPSGSDDPLEKNISSPDAKGNTASQPRAAVTFDADGKAVIEFFATSDFSSAPHELYHVFRREMAQTAAHPEAPARVREDWAKIEEFVGAEPGQKWTREMEEKFARAGEQFLLEGKAPAPQLQTVFEKLRQWFLELYANADAAGLQITDEMHTIFGNMLTTPMKDGDKAFRYALGSMMTRSFVEDVDTRLPSQPDLDGKPLEAVQALSDEAVKDLDAQWRQVQEAHPDLKDVVGEAYREDVNMAEMEMAEAHRRKEILAEIAQCETRR
ncbi:hypothetical protein [Desulfovibrio intestinalis]|uniref:Large polyvalent protein associated domain-containing protein n=1 Tax=Desulfovibrio intestinalis TaxID=58621 RepID=A0A7W8FFI2_9BACT|nr:hypothetical protein [Desulfovibrio intestinalis]MBB5143958.1 hypothetical protein [Desulfovibrio intestinalis]